MSRSYAITWQNGAGPARSGKLELRAAGLRLEGREGERPGYLLIPYADLLGLEHAGGRDRLDGRPTLVLTSRTSGLLKIAGVGSPGILQEVAENLTSMRAGTALTAERVAVVVPLRKGKREQAERLLDKGPPFDPERAGLERHEVFLTDHEAIFVFNAAAGLSLQRLLSDTKVWASAAAWHDVLAGPPRMAMPFFAWAAASEAGDLFFDPTPGPGDSDGGDIYSPA